MSSAAADTILTEFTEDKRFMELFKDAMDDCEMAESATAEWPHNLLSKQLVVYGDGMISKRNVKTTHKVSARELELCRTISKELAEACTQDIGMADEGDGTFSPFYVAAQLKDDFVKPTEITQDLIKSTFAGTLFPGTTMKIEPLEAAGSWWEIVSEDAEDSGPDYLRPWHEMIRLFRSNSHLKKPVFVQLGDSYNWSIEEDDYPEGTVSTGPVLPRMALALTDNGSIVGLFGTVVHA